MRKNTVFTKKGPKIGLNIGASSILVVFILLCLVTFATLSLVSANADYRLSKRVADHTGAYYDATASAREDLALRAANDRPADEPYDEVTPMSEKQQIHVTATLHPDHTYNIHSWTVENVGSWEPDHSITVITE